ncbi:capsular biosynthesis protein [Pseudomonas sp. BP8]|uniref:capsule biosynthesis protein n=1 Tax=Pseudomonas sp. BP8 TaxID=2817864 RepID=UPI001AE6A192|nr:capsular biosynthesis protein [Pseudomonas sp. BP8]MBP2263669.1 capsular polysaccharide export protein [Pseudomonas sp. BP8]HDS1736322.1 capsular biosynthesis protein [Pseudomonas putida]
MAGLDSTLEQFVGHEAPDQLSARATRRPLLGIPQHNFLFLQGVSSPFFQRLAKGLRDIGQRVHSVRFNVGDVMYGANGARMRFPNRLEEARDWYAQVFRELDITDLVLFGDCRPVHQPAVALARLLGIRVHVFEEGYFRPYWVTLERDGVNNHSRLPRDPQWYREVGRHIPRYQNGNPFKLSFTARATHDVLYHAGGALNALAFPRYRTHAPFNAAVEYAGFIRQGLRLLRARNHDDALVAEVARERRPTFLLPLQLDSDAQIRDHSPFQNMTQVIEHVIDSFSLHAPFEARLLIKNHPLTPGLVNYQKITEQLAKKYDVADRVDFLESGHMPTLLSHIAGMITVNSTAGASAILHHRPTCTLADPIYAMPGLTHQGNLKDFWMHHEAPDNTLFQRFRNTVIHTTQVNGGFYTPCGMDMAVANCLEVLMAKTSRIEKYL